MRINPDYGFGVAVLEGNVEQMRYVVPESRRNCHHALSTRVLEEAFEEGRAEEPQCERGPEPSCREPRAQTGQLGRRRT